MSSKFQLNIPNRLPKGLEAQALINTDQVIAALLEQGLEEQAKPFLQDLTADTKRDPLATWTRWEGYYVEHKDSVTLCVVGALYFQGQIYVRGLVVLNVPDNILVIGNPEGLTGTISDGMIAAIRHYPKNWLQITAPISPGSSGS